MTWFSRRLETKALIQESTLQLQWPVEVRRSARRRTLEVRVTWDNRVRVLCPMILNDAQIADFVSAKSGWIESKLRITASKINGSSQIINRGIRSLFSRTNPDSGGYPSRTDRYHA